MGLRCLIGHDYASPETEQEREERGDEVVVTIREFKECRRCGDRQVISENTEVRTTETADPVPDESSATGSGPSGSSAAPDSTGTAGKAESPDEYDEMSAEDDDGVIIRDEPDEAAGREPGQWPDADTESEEETDPDEGADQEREPEERLDESDGEDDDSSDELEASGDWPDAEQRPGPASAEPREWPETDEADEGYDAVADDGEGLEDVEFGGGLTPERSTGNDETLEDETVEGESAGREARAAPAGIRSESAGPSPTGRRDGNSTNELECPECENVAADGASLRPGDICPECRRGYLTERTE